MAETLELPRPAELAVGLCVVFARSARGHSPLAERLAAEVIGLRKLGIGLCFRDG